MIDNQAIPLFQEKKVLIIKDKQIDKYSVASGRLCFKNGLEIPKPALIQMPKWLWGEEWYLYADSCPFYKEKNCEIHENSRRPDVCKRYPIILLGCNDPEGKKLDVEIMKSCECFNRKEIQDALTKKFPVRIIEIR
jgi:Fe-S-cluster containining protein